MPHQPPKLTLESLRLRIAANRAEAAQFAAEQMSRMDAAAEELASCVGDMAADGHCEDTDAEIRKEAPEWARRYGVDPAELERRALAYNKPDVPSPDPDEAVRVLHPR